MSAAEKLKPQQIEIKLVIKKGPHEGQRFSFSKSEITMGRAPENDIVLLNDPLISRQHAKIVVLNDEVEVVNLSQKNFITVDGESVQRWKLVNDGHFQIGDTEFEIQFDLGKSVVAVAQKVAPLKPQVGGSKAAAKPAPKHPTPVPLKNQQAAMPPAMRQQVPAKMNQNLQARPQQGMAQPGRPQMMSAGNMGRPMQQPGHPGVHPNSYQTPAAKKNNPMFFYILILAVFAIAGYFYLDQPKKNAQTVPPVNKPGIVRGTAESVIQIASEKERKEAALRNEKLKQMNSPTALRAQENFIRGMREFQLGNYSVAQESFQLVLNLESNNVLARKHLELSKIRFDEVLKAKIMLGDSYYDKHNFKMCQSMFEQVLNMLNGRSSDVNYQYADHMQEKCRLAAEGIR